MALVPGEAGVFIGSGEISRTSLADDLGLAQGICSALYPIDFLKDDFGKFNRNPKELFVIDKEQFAKDTKCLNVGVWAVPNRNKQSFEYYNPGIPADLVYKVDRVEPQIWICAEPF